MGILPYDIPSIFNFQKRPFFVHCASPTPATARKWTRRERTFFARAALFHLLTKSLAALFCGGETPPFFLPKKVFFGKITSVKLQVDPVRFPRQIGLSTRGGPENG